MPRLWVDSPVYDLAQGRPTLDTLDANLRTIFEDLNAITNLEAVGYAKRGCQVVPELLMELLEQDDGVESWNRALRAFHATYPDAEAVVGPANQDFLERLVLDQLDLRGMMLEHCRVQHTDFILCDLRKVRLPYFQHCYLDCCQTDRRELKKAYGFESYYRERADKDVRPMRDRERPSSL